MPRWVPVICFHVSLRAPTPLPISRNLKKVQIPAVSLLHRPWARSGGIGHGIDFFVFQGREGDDQAVSREFPLLSFGL